VRCLTLGVAVSYHQTAHSWLANVVPQSAHILIIARIWMLSYWVCADVDTPPVSCRDASMVRRQWPLCGSVSQFQCAVWH
jgi:hypothetical protein